IADLSTAVGDMLERIHRGLYQRALELRESRTSKASSPEEFRRILREEPGFILAHWCGRAECEAAIKAETGATIRCIPLDGATETGECINDGQPSNQRVIFARAY